MTDRNVEQTSHGASTPSGTRRLGDSPSVPLRPRSTRPGKRADPTEPEVPSAKRLRALRRQRSTLLVATAVVALVSVVLFLLYKTGRQVTTLHTGEEAAAP